MKNKNLVLRVQEALSNDATVGNCVDNIYIMENDGEYYIMAGSVHHERLRIRAKQIASEVKASIC